MPSLAGPSGKTMTGTTPHRPDGQRPNTYVGAAIERNEDLRFLRGRGCYLDDLVRPGQWHAAFVRSPLAHGRIVRIDTTAAMAMRGVRAVITGADIGPIIPKNSVPPAEPSPRPSPHREGRWGEGDARLSARGADDARSLSRRTGKCQAAAEGRKNFCPPSVGTQNKLLPPRTARPTR